MKTFFLASLAATAAAFDSFDGSFDAYVQHFGKTYASDAHRDAASAHFEASKRRVAAHNARALSWRAGLNQFSDMSDDEFEAAVLMDPQECSATGGVGADADADLPDALDWRSRGVVSEVKNQGHCGSCWTFSTVGALESHLALKQDAWRAPRLSEQQLVDCAGAFDTKGCAGGLPSHAFEYVKYAGGLSTEFSYPYRGVDQACAFNATASSSGLPTSAGVGVVVPGGSVNITKGDEVCFAASPRATRVTRVRRRPSSTTWRRRGPCPSRSRSRPTSATTRRASTRRPCARTGPWT